ncbi:tetratricopeptide repeat protein [Rhodobacter sp. SY28-1]|uniref:tetratricopeptide repeat protein n=1 Tax=Rhodobacter sp. SY28-1 TaxID=2562317 RepID=UPI0010BF745E|nr:tetratricopeptide repeat protein [Rhodobacter sp. SY28-1]
MSNPDSFIEEVTEEVRRDRLFRLFRKYGWIGVVVIIGLVAGTAWTEWSKSRDEARAEAFGDALIDALDHGTPDERREALAAVPSDAEQTAILNLILASDPAGDKAATLAALDKVTADASLSPAYRDLAVLRRVLVAGADQPIADRRAALDGIAVAGRPYRVLATEQLAYLLIEEGKTDEAITALTALLQDQEASGSLRSRVAQVITALDGSLPEASGG